MDELIHKALDGARAKFSKKPRVALTAESIARRPTLTDLRIPKSNSSTSTPRHHSPGHRRCDHLAPTLVAPTNVRAPVSPGSWNGTPRFQ